MNYFREDGTPAVGKVKPLENSPGIWTDSEAVRVYTKAQADALVKAENIRRSPPIVAKLPVKATSKTRAKLAKPKPQPVKSKRKIAPKK